MSSSFAANNMLTLVSRGMGRLRTVFTPGATEDNAGTFLHLSQQSPRIQSRGSAQPLLLLVMLTAI